MFLVCVDRHLGSAVLLQGTVNFELDKMEGQGNGQKQVLGLQGEESAGASSLMCVVCSAPGANVTPGVRWAGDAAPESQRCHLFPFSVGVI